MGIAGRYPQAANLDELLNRLAQGADCITEIPESRRRLIPASDTDDCNGGNDGTHALTAGGYLNDIEMFDPFFFGIAPREAAFMDPQERLLLQIVWHALEQGGYSIDKLHSHSTVVESLGLPRHQVGVYVGLSAGQFWPLLARDAQKKPDGGRDIFVQPSSWSVANRLSYFFDLHGPSLSMDTACSSSLTALHLACEALRRGEIKIAIVGGVSLNLDPLRNPALAQSHFLAADRRCRSFGAGGDGFVPGEGVAAVMLKPLAAAIADNDYIQGVIRGTAVNHGGRTNGYTVPSPEVQASVIAEAMQNADIAPAAVSYIEAHGTGTALGDPIEISGLAKVFNPAPGNSVAIGSIKSNIGHLEPAAALAGLTKIILQFKTGQLFPSLHAERENPDIDFSATPFYLQKELAPWVARQTVGANAKRIAALSSFGAGGANGHLILEEYEKTEEKPQANPVTPQLLMFSAITKPQLGQVLDQYIEFIDGHISEGSQDKISQRKLKPFPPFYDFGYMLRGARTHLDYRLAFVAGDYRDTLNKLRHFRENCFSEPLHNEITVNGNYPFGYGRITDRAAHARKNMPLEALQTLRKEQGWQGVIDQWLENAVFPWHRFETGSLACIESLPLYPFELKPLWFRAPDMSAPRDKPYPFPFASSVTDEGVRYTFHLSSADPIVQDHRINGELIVAATAQLELARKSAVEYGAIEEGAGFAFSSLVWARPLAVEGDGVDIHIDLIPPAANAGGSLRFRVQTRHLHAQGEIESLHGNKSLLNPGNSQPESALTGEKLYSLLREAGFDYGDYYRGIARIEYDRTACRSSMVPSDRRDLQALAFHPGVVDACLQTVGVLDGRGRTTGFLPYAVREIRVLKPARHIVSVRACSKAAAEEYERRYDIAMLNAKGETCIEYIAFTCRAIASVAATQPADDSIYLPAWQEVEVVDNGRAPDCDRYIIFAPQKDFGLAQALYDYHGGDRVRVVRCPQPLSSEACSEALGSAAGGALKIYFLLAMAAEPYQVLNPDNCSRSLETSVFALFHIAKALFALSGCTIKLDIIANDMAAVAVQDSAFNVLANGVVGMSKSLAKELLSAEIRLIDLAKTDLDRCAVSGEWGGLLEQLRKLPVVLPEAMIAMRNNRVYRESFVPARLAVASRSGDILRRGGIYLIVGGAGGLGRVTAQFLMEHYQARVILVGRRPEPTVELPVHTLAGSYCYRQTDINEAVQSDRLIEEIISEYGAINGVFHSAIVLEDRSLVRMHEATLARVLAPKTIGAVNLLRSLENRRLDFIAFYSSATSQVCAAGQANYAAACTFEDALARHIAKHYPRVLIINWGYWSQVGIVATDSYRQAFAAKGIAGLTVEDGLRIFHRTLNSPHLQIFTGSNSYEQAALDSGTTVAGNRATLIKQHLQTFWHSLGINEVADNPSPRLTRITRDLILSYFREHGLFLREGELWSGESLAIKIGVIDEYRPLFDAVIDIFEQGNILQRDRGGFKVSGFSKPEGREVLEREIRALCDQYADVKPMLVLLQRCIGHLFPVLSGQCDYTQVLFPQGSDRLVEPLYKENLSAELFNRCVAQSLVAYGHSLEGESRQKPIKILEVGAGTGATTCHILSAIENFSFPVEYHYTDISSHFINRARRELGEKYPFLRFFQLDIEQEPGRQGCDPHSYDMVIAANVLHATRDILQVLQHLHSLLSDPGLVVINEAVERRDAVTLTFGLTRGWWLAQDRQRRIEHSPLLNPAMWRDVLLQSGFGQIEFLGDNPSRAVFGQSVILGWTKTVEKSCLSSNGQTLNFIRTTLSELQKIPLEEIENDIAFARYGVDSIVALELLDKIEKIYGKQPTDLIINENTVNRLAAYLDCLRPAQSEKSEGEKRMQSATTPDRFISSVKSADDTLGLTAEKNSPAQSLVAIVGVAGRYPGARNPEEFWENILQGKCLFTGPPAERWWLQEPDIESGSTWGGYIDKVDCFDSLFFGISPREAQAMDPQERLMLEVAWETLEDGGYTPARLNRCVARNNGAGVGVFIGTMYGHYQLLAAAHWVRGKMVSALSAYYAVANTISRCLDFTGPSLVLDSACSASLSCLHTAVQNLQSGDCGAALVGGVNLILHPVHQVALSAMNMTSPDGQCRVFSGQANGFVPGEGAGAVLLKRLADAEREGDHIYAVIRATALNANGAAMAAAPNRSAQAELIYRTYKKAGLDPAAVDYIEAQSMGSILGDKTEIQALAEAFRRFPGVASNTWLGSLKPNIGHLEAAAGMAQLTKVLLQLKHNTLVKTLCQSPLWEEIPFAEAGVSVVCENTPWQSTNGPRRAAVSSFGAGGSNAQVLVEEYPQPPASTDTAEIHLLPLSARKTALLQHGVQRLLHWLEKNPSCSLADLTYTQQVGRIGLRQRLCIVFKNRAELKTALCDYLNGRAQDECSAVTVLRGEANTSNTPFQHDSFQLGKGDHLLTQEQSLLLAQHWVKGSEIDWEALYTPARGGGRPRVMSLPTYPFESVRHWFEAGSAEPANVTQFVEGSEGNETNREKTAELSAVSDDGLFSQKDVEQLVISNIGKTLKIPLAEIHLEDSLSDFGFESITLMELVKRFTDEYPIDMDVTVLFEYPTLAGLSRYLYDNHRQSFQRVRMQATPIAPRPRTIPFLQHSPRAIVAKSPSRQHIAIIGMAGRFPGSENLAEFWQNLSQGRQVVSGLPCERREKLGLYRGAAEYPELEKYCYGAFLDHIDHFDPLFFKISPTQAQSIDPQQRLMLQTVWSTIEEAGYDPCSLAGSLTGVFIGGAASEYGQVIHQSRKQVGGENFTGVLNTMLPNRISFVLDLQGPSEPVDTACSSSLAAVHRAVQSIRCGECETALAGGVSLILTFGGFIAFGASGMLAEDGCCKSFDERADGYVRGEGVAAVYLKPVEKARADGDNIRGIIRGSAIRHGGHATSITAPNVKAQVQLLNAALADAGIPAARLGYIEAHGTGTKIGDPIEINALKQVFAPADSDEQTAKTCAIGTVKSNLGHLEAAAGIAGLIKTVLCLKHKILPALATLDTDNKMIRLENTPLYLLREKTPWSAPTDSNGETLPRCAGVSSFGVGGVIVHLILEEEIFEQTLPAQQENAPYIIALSAKSEQQLREYALNLIDTLSQPSTPALRDIALTLLYGRHAYSHRLALVASTQEEVICGLKSFCDQNAGGNQFFHDHTANGNSLPELMDRESAGVLAEHYIRQRDFGRLALLWVKGVALDWQALWPTSGYKKVSLPTYPFARETCWVSIRPVAATSKNNVLPKESGVAAKPNQTGNSISEKITAILSDVLQIPESRLNPETPLVDYGVDSLSGLRIMQRLHKDYGDHIPVAAIIENPTVTQLSAYLAAHTAQGLPDQDKKDERSELVITRIQLLEGKMQSPLIVVCAATGELGWIMHWLSELAQGQAVVGLEPAPPVSSPGAGFSAGQFVEQALLHLESLPLKAGIRLAGFGITASLAAALAERLNDRRRRIDKLLLFSPQPEQTTHSRPASVVVAALYNVLWRKKEQRRELPVSLFNNEGEAGLHTLREWLWENTAVPVPEEKLLPWLRSAVTYVKRFQSMDDLRWKKMLAGSIPCEVYATDRQVLETCSRYILHMDAYLVNQAAADGESLLGNEIPPRRSSYRISLDDPGQLRRVPLVTINKNGRYPRLYCLPTFYGDAGYAVTLSYHLGSEFPVYALEQMDMNAQAVLHRDVESIARVFVELLLDNSDPGPYTLLGLSYGGLLAFEMCQQLQELGREVDRLLLIDPYMPHTEAADVFNGIAVEVQGVDLNKIGLASVIFERWQVRKQLDFAVLVDQSPERQTELIVEHLYKESARVLSYEEARRIIETYIEVDSSNRHAFKSYKARILLKPVDTLMLSAIQGFYNPRNHATGFATPLEDIPIPADSSRGFKAFLRGNFELVELDADHIMLPKCMDVCAKHIARYLRITSNNEAVAEHGEKWRVANEI
ncbi:MAG: SDR family NAD(P)-dependent oxidoreductase [Exilibacterium sp.]